MFGDVSCNLSSQIRNDSVYKDCAAGGLKLISESNCLWFPTGRRHLCKYQGNGKQMKRSNESIFFVSPYIRMIGVTKVIWIKCMLPSLLEGWKGSAFVSVQSR